MTTIERLRHAAKTAVDSDLLNASASELEALQKERKENYERISWLEQQRQFESEEKENALNCSAKLLDLRDALQKENAELRETIAINREALEIGIKWQRNSALEEWFPITAEELTALRDQNEAMRELLADCERCLRFSPNVDDLGCIKRIQQTLAAQPEGKAGAEADSH